MKIGDTVKLKSGGPKMTVDTLINSIDGVKRVECKWFLGNIQHTGTFAEEALELC